MKLGIDPEAAPAICSGPNIVNFTKIASLKEMIDHIYGRISLLTNPDRPSIFVSELRLYIDYFRKEIENGALDQTHCSQKYLIEFKENLLEGIEYYLNVSDQYIKELTEQFIKDMRTLKSELEMIPLPVPV